MHVRIVRFRSRARWRSGPRTSPRPQSAFSLQSSAFRKPRKLVLLTADCRLLTAGPGDFAGPGHVCVPSRRTDPAFRFATRSAEPIRPFGSPREAPNRSGLSVRHTKRRADPAFRFASRSAEPIRPFGSPREPKPLLGSPIRPFGSPHEPKPSSGGRGRRPTDASSPRRTGMQAVNPLVMSARASDKSEAAVSLQSSVFSLQSSAFRKTSQARVADGRLPTADGRPRRLRRDPAPAMGATFRRRATSAPSTATEQIRVAARTRARFHLGSPRRARLPAHCWQDV